MSLYLYRFCPAWYAPLCAVGTPPHPWGQRQDTPPPHLSLHVPAEWTATLRGYAETKYMYYITHSFLKYADSTGCNFISFYEYQKKPLYLQQSERPQRERITYLPLLLGHLVGSKMSHLASLEQHSNLFGQFSFFLNLITWRKKFLLLLKIHRNQNTCMYFMQIAWKGWFIDLMLLTESFFTTKSKQIFLRI